MCSDCVHNVIAAPINPALPMNSLPAYKTAHYHRSLALLQNAKNLSDAARETRLWCQKAFRHLGPDVTSDMNPFPISGGVCSYWPDSAKDAVISLVREAQAAFDLSFEEWKKAGNRRSTWLAQKEKVFGAGTTVL